MTCTMYFVTCTVVVGNMYGSCNYMYGLFGETYGSFW